MKKLILTAIVLLSAVYASAMTLEDSKLISIGGPLYDNWYEAKGVKAPEGNQPSYVGKKNGATTWRCKECHGWDLKGVDGAYSSGSHRTGVKGLTAYRNGDVKDIVAILKNDTHQYATLMSETELTALATFVAKTQIDSTFIDMKTKRVTGDALAGGIVFNGICAKCHGFDGKQINFGEKGEEFVNEVINANPWEVLHKVRFGHPGSQMTGLFAFKTSLAADILSYAQDLK